MLRLRLHRSIRRTVKQVEDLVGVVSVVSEAVAVVADQAVLVVREAGKWGQSIV